MNELTDEQREQLKKIVEEQKLKTPTVVSDAKHITYPEYKPLDPDFCEELKLFFADPDNVDSPLEHPELKKLVEFCIPHIRRGPQDTFTDINSIIYNVECIRFGRTDKTNIVPPEKIEKILGRFVFNLDCKEIYRIDAIRGGEFKKAIDNNRKIDSGKDKTLKRMKIPKLDSGLEFLLNDGDFIYTPREDIPDTIIYVLAQPNQTVRKANQISILRPRNYNRKTVIVDIYSK